MKPTKPNTARLLTPILTGTLVLTAWGMLSACNSVNPAEPMVDIRGKSVSEASEDIASALCRHMARCGKVSFECSGTCDRDNNCTESCSGTIEPITYDDCMDDVSQDFEQMLECADPTDEEKGQINDCINEWAHQSCLSQEEVDAMAQEMEQGIEPSNMPESCQAMDSIFASCQRDAQPGAEQ